MATQAKQPPSIENKPSNVAVDINIPAVKSPYTQDFIIEQQRQIRENIGGQRQTAETGIQSSLQGLESAMTNTQGQNRALAQAGITGVLPEELQGALRQYAGPSSMGLMDELRRSRIGGQRRILGQQMSDIEAGETARVSTGRTALERQAQAIEQEALLGEAQLAQQQEQAVAEQNLNLINAYYDAIDAQEKRQIEFQKEVLNTNKDLFKFYGAQEFQQFQNELDSQQQAVNQRIKEREDVNDLKKTILERNPNAPEAILRAQSVEELLEVPNVGRFIQDPIARMDLAVKQAQLNKLRAETSALNNPQGVSSATLSKINKLAVTDREALQNARTTKDQLNRMKEIIGDNSDIKTFLRTSPDSREFRRLAKDVADKLARERTGAVVGADEQSNFKDILGVGFFNAITSDDAEITKTLDQFINIHDETLALVDPTGEINEFLDTSVGITATPNTNPANVSDTTRSIVDQGLQNLQGIEVDPYTDYINSMLSQ